MQISKITSRNSKFPDSLRHIELAPKQLYILGDLGDAPKVAIVGSRAPTAYGKRVTYDFAYELARAGVTVVSGLANGIDAEAHRGAIDGGGKTIAVMAGGLDRIYPPSNRSLALKILETGGAIVSEYPEKTDPLKFRFLERNRIISGLSLGTVVTEASIKSGSLVTADYAKKQDRIVMAVPGPITSQLSAGPNNLIRDVATAIVSTSDILAAVDLASMKLATKQIAPASAIEAKILEAMNAGNAKGQDLIAATGMDAAHFAGVISLMEISGKVRNLGASTWIPRK
ncbi:MAG: DNA-processing protein DprA [Candidatus Saccharibacteria bacterium]